MTLEATSWIFFEGFLGEDMAVTFGPACEDSGTTFLTFRVRLFCPWHGDTRGKLAGCGNII
jgi:hypothetical protein